MKKILVVFLCLIASNFVFAADNQNNVNSSEKKPMANNAKWTCSTNASGAANDADKKADETMANTAKSAKEAFKFALAHCRDCTKITCETSR